MSLAAQAAVLDIMAQAHLEHYVSGAQRAAASGSDGANRDDDDATPHELALVDVCDAYVSRFRCAVMALGADARWRGAGLTE